MSLDPLVLLVEDAEEEVELAKLALSRAGPPHRLRVCRDGQEAVDYLGSDETHGDVPAVVLLDLKLPRMDGKTVLRELRGNPNTARVPVVVLSGSRLEQDLLDAYVLGANSYVQKPVSFATFQSYVAVLVRNWLVLNVPARAEAEFMSWRDAAPLPGPVVSSGTPPPRRGFPDVPTRGRPADVLIIGGSSVDRDRTMEALGEVLQKETIACVETFQHAKELLHGVGGPPPLLAPEFPRLFFVDPSLPDGDGRDIIQALRYRADHHAIIVVFGRDLDPALVSECYRLKVNSVVNKPADDATFREAVRLLGHYWIRMSERPPPPSLAFQAIAHPG